MTGSTTSSRCPDVGSGPIEDEDEDEDEPEAAEFVSYSRGSLASEAEGVGRSSVTGEVLKIVRIGPSRRPRKGKGLSR